MTEKNVRQLASDFVDRLRVYKELSIREKAFVSTIQEVSDDTLADVIMYVISRAYRKDEKYLDISALFTSKELLRQGRGERGMFELMRIAVHKGYKELAVFLMDNSAVPIQQEIDEPLPDPKVNGLPLGLRKSLSKSHSRDVLEKLLYDQEPSVITVLLGNPRITESDIIKIVSRRPNSEHILRTVYNNQRWKYRYRILCALAMNPYTPADITLGILPELFSTDLSKIINDSRLPDIIRLQARTILGQETSL